MKSRAWFSILLLCLFFVGSAHAAGKRLFYPGIGSADPNDSTSHDLLWSNPDNWCIEVNHKPSDATHEVPSGGDWVYLAGFKPGDPQERAIVDYAAPEITGQLHPCRFSILDIVDGGSLVFGPWSYLSQTCCSWYGRNITNISGNGSLLINGKAVSGHSTIARAIINLTDTATLTSTDSWVFGRNAIDGGGRTVINVCEDAVFTTRFFYVEPVGINPDMVKVNLSGNGKVIITDQNQYVTAKTVDNILNIVDGGVFGDPNDVVVSLIPEDPDDPTDIGDDDIEIKLVDPNDPVCNRGLGLQGDLTGNCVVDIDDVVLMAANWAGDELIDMTQCDYLEGDIDGDCVVDLRDFAALAARWDECAWSDPALCPLP